MDFYSLRNKATGLMKNVASLATFRTSPSMEPMTDQIIKTTTPEAICTEKLILGMNNAAYIGLKITTDLNCQIELPPLPLIPLEFSPKHEGKKVASLGLNIDHLEVSILPFAHVWHE